MWHRYSDELRTVVYKAMEAADAEGRKDISTTHLLWGLTDEKAGIAAQVLRRLKVAVDTIRDPERCEPDAPTAERTLTPMAREAVEGAYREAVALDGHRIHTDHLLLGLLRSADGDAARWLDSQGVTLRTATEALCAIEPQRFRVPEGVSLPNASARRVKEARHALVRKTNNVKRAVRALSQLPTEPILISFVARPLRVEYPHWFFRNLRARGFYKSQLAGGWIATDYDDAVRVMKEPAWSAARYDWERIAGHRLPPLINREFNRMCGSLAQEMIFLDAPEQTRLRGLISRQFTPRVLENMRQQIQEITDRLLNAVELRGEMDVIHDFAFPLPATVIARLLGIADTDLDEFRRWSDDFVKFIGGQSSLSEEFSAYHSLKRLAEYFGREIARLRTEPKNNTLLSLFVHAEDADGSRLTDTEIITNSMLLLAAGHETTTHLIGNGLILLMRHPEARKQLQADPSLWPSAIEEMLRFEPPVQWNSRVAREDTELHGVQIRKGEWANIALAAANRDPKRFPNPDVFDITRADNKHLSFGFGPHYCLGAALARMEGAIALSTLLHRFPHLRPVGRKVYWRVDFTFRAQTKLPVKLGTV